jgi:TrmH family RNA methyltransferase
MSRSSTPPRDPLALMSSVVISSRENSIVKLARSLRLREHRAAERAFIVEGARAVQDAVAAGGVVRWLIAREGYSPTTPIDPKLVRVVTPGLFDAIAQTESPQGVLAIFDLPDMPLPELPSPFFVILDGIADPGNMGTIIRTCAAAGVDALLLRPGCVDPFNPKVARAGMGAHFRLPIIECDDAMLEQLGQRLARRIVSDGGSPLSYDKANWTDAVALVIGSEAHGVTDKLMTWATEFVSIPMSAGVESLNAAVATGVLVFEARRQRQGR